MDPNECYRRLYGYVRVVHRGDAPLYRATIGTVDGETVGPLRADLAAAEAAAECEAWRLAERRLDAELDGIPMPFGQ